ncbi:poly(A) RNA polymerase gld-2 homolog B isoform X2 [Scaptodrosophila lebanonensis]|uniref:Poly(A) RNA polymerase gld-2 homolog B isoform X2 n=1 Tax=Drosophila lebanonensis TaxID=7225 RepID=A0A6J2UDN4_DROLE|nr:poly(A) RNA polymerase gld-2 homolog B isoform X2 [Scaptodrosophila lebanonensis]
MYTASRADMKIFATNIDAPSSDESITATSTGMQQQQRQQQQQRKFRQCFAATAAMPSQTVLVQQTKQQNVSNNTSAKYNNANEMSNKSANLLRQSVKFHNHTGNKRQQQQQQLFGGNNHSIVRKNSGNDSNLQSPHYFQQQQHISAASTTTITTTTNNNSVLMKNQNIQTNDANNNDNNNHSGIKLTTKTSKNHKKRNALSSSSSMESSYYRSCSESSAVGTEKATIASTASTSPNALAHIGAESCYSAVIDQLIPMPQSKLQNGTSNCNEKQVPRQQSLCFWNTSDQVYVKPQAYVTTTTQQHMSALSSKQLETSNLSGMSKTTPTTIEVGSNNKQSQRSLQYKHRSPELERTNYQQQQQPQQQQSHYYQNSYPQPKQLTIASFLQKELLPDNEIASEQSSSNNRHSAGNNRHSGNNYSRQQQQQQQGQYQRYGNAHYIGGSYSHNNNHSQNNSHSCQQHQQQQMHQQHANYRRKHNNNNNNSIGIGKKMHFGYSIAVNANANGSGCGSGSGNVGGAQILSVGTPTSTIATTSSASAAATTSNNFNRRLKNNYSNNFNHNGHHPLMLATSGPVTTAHHQNFYNLTYVKVDVTDSQPQPQLPTATHLTASPQQVETTATATAAAGGVDGGGGGEPVALTMTGVANKQTAALLLTPAITLTKPITPQPNGVGMFVPPPNTLQYNAAILSRVIMSPEVGGAGDAAVLSPTTPANMIRCAQLDEAITAAAASDATAAAAELPLAAATVVALQSPTYAAVPLMLQPVSVESQNNIKSQLLPATPIGHQQQQPQQQQQLIFGFPDSYPTATAAIWNHVSSPCYQTPFAALGASPHSHNHHQNLNPNQVELRDSSARSSISPASSDCSLASLSEPHWSNRNRLMAPTMQRHPPQHQSHHQLQPQPYMDLLSPTMASSSSTPSPQHQALPQPQLSPQLAGMSGMHGMPQAQLQAPPPQPQQQSSYGPPPLLGAGGHNYHPHYCGNNCGCGSNSNGSNASISSMASSSNMPLAGWYETMLPPDRYLVQARNVELTAQPEHLVRNCKYDGLSVDIWKRFRSAQQTHKMFKLKMRLWRHLCLWINQPMFSRFRICLVGSTITGFGTDSSDIDMCLLPQQQPQQPAPHQYHYHNEQRTEALIILNLFHEVLKETVVSNRLSVEIFQEFNLIEARVPILRFKDGFNGIEVDLNYNNCVGIKNTYLLQLYAQLDWRTRPLVVIVKLWAQYHDINDAKRMTISSYSLVLMVLHYLQYGCVPHVLPCLHALYPEKFNLGQQDCVDLDLIEPIETYATHNTQTLGEHLLGFFKYYSNFDFRNYAISVRTGGVLPVAVCRMAKSYKNDAHQWKELNIEEPFDLSNTARSVYDFATFERVKSVFAASARRLEHSLNLNAIFAPIDPISRPPLHQYHHPTQRKQQQTFFMQNYDGIGGKMGSTPLGSHPPAASHVA